MTEIEAKALALVNETCDPGYAHDDLNAVDEQELRDALIHAARCTKATEALHAAEMRELKERFSEAVERVLTVTDRRQETHAWRVLSPFILPAPDPLVEVFASLPVGFAGCVDGADALRAAMLARGYEWRKIGEAGE